MATTITPIAALPTTAGAVSGSFTATSRKVRLSVALKKGGADTLEIVRQNGTTYWESTGRSVTLERSAADISGGVGSVDIDAETAEVYHVVSKTGFARDTANAVVKMENLSPPAATTAGIDDHGGNHVTDDLIPIAVAGGAPGLMSGEMAEKLAQLSGDVPGAATFTTDAADGGAGTVAYTSDNTTSLTAGRLWSERNAGVEKFAVRYDGGAIAPTIGPAYAQQHTLPAVTSDTFALLAAAQTFATGTKTFTAAMVISGGVTSGGGNFDLSGSSGTFKTSTGAATIGGGSAAIGITSSAAAITITAGAASTWKTTAGALNVEGFAGVNLKLNGTTLADVGATNSAKLTLAAGISLSAAAGATGLDLGSATGDTALPTGALSWAGASSKAASLVSTSAAITVTAGAASVWKTSSGALRVDSAAALNLGTSDATSVVIGAASVAPSFPGGLTVAASKQVVGAVGTVSAPGFTFTGSLTTGLYSAGANTMALATNGTVALSIDASQVATFSGNVLVSTTATLQASSGKLTKYNNETTAAVGAAYIVASGQDVASSGAGSQTTDIAATGATPATGLYRVSIAISAHTNNDTVTARVTYTDAVEGFATTLTPISAVALTADSNTGTTYAVVIVRASAASAIKATLITSGQSTTKCSATVERLQ